MFALTALLGTVAATFFVFRVMLSSEASGDGGGGGGEVWDEARDGTLETATSVGDVGFGSVGFVGTVLGIFSFALLLLIAILVVLTALGVGMANFNDELSGAADEAFTTVWSPFYRTVVLGIADPLLSIAEVILPISNSINGSWRILRSNAISQMLDCIDLIELVSRMRDVVLAIFQTMIAFVLQFGLNDLDVYNPLRKTQLVVETLAPALDCWCQATTPVTDVAIAVVTSGQLAAFLDRTANLPLVMFKDFFGSIFQILVGLGGTVGSEKGFVAKLGDFYWEPNRAPFFERTIRVTGQQAARFADWLDDAVSAMVQSFLLIPADDVPRFFGVLGNYGESIILDVNVFVDATLKPLRYLSLIGTRHNNVTWYKSRPVALRSQKLLTDAFDKAYNGSELLEVFFQTWGKPLSEFNGTVNMSKAKTLLNLTGCITREGADIFTVVLELSLRAIIAAYHERIIGGDYGEYMRGPDFQKAINQTRQSLFRYVDCTAGFYSELNDPLGRLINESGHVAVAFVEPFLALHRNWDDRKNFLTGTEFKDVVDNTFFEMDAWSVALGNFFRQMAFVNDSLSDPGVDCRLRSPHWEQSPTETAPNLADWEAFYPWYVDPFCCVGGAVEEGSRLITGSFEGIVRAIVLFVAGPSFSDGFVNSFKTGGPLDLRVEFLPMMDFFLRDVFRFSCIKFGIARGIADVFFSGLTIPCGSGDESFWELTVRAITGFVRVPFKVVVGGAAEIWSWIVDLIDDSVGMCSTDCWCLRLKSLYSTTGGQFTDWLADFFDLAICAFGSKSELLSGLSSWNASLRNVFGSAGKFATGNMFCIIADFFTTVWDLFACWAGGDSGFFGCLFDLIMGAIDELLDAVIDCLGDAWSELKDTITCLPNAIWGWIQAFYSGWKCLTNLPLGFSDCPKLSTYTRNCKFTIPRTCGAGSLGLTTGAVAFTYTGLRTEQITRVGSACDLLEPLSPEWFACVDTPVTTYIEFATAYVDYANIARDVQKISDTAGGFFGTLYNGDEFGRAIAGIGDLNEDGWEDIVVGTPYYDAGGTIAVNSGAIWIIFLNSDGTVKAYHHVSNLAGWTLTPLLGAGDLFGSSVANLGDVNGDNVTDIAVGASLDDDGGLDHGAVYVLFLDTNGVVLSGQKISDTAGSFAGTLPVESYFGHSVAGLGDLNVDGVPDLLVGSYQKDHVPVTSRDDAGSVWILFLTAAGTVNLYKEINAYNTAGFPAYLGRNDFFGSSVTAIGDVDGDGVIDIAVGAIGQDAHPDIPPPNVGEVWILFLRTTGSVKSVVRIGDKSVGFFEKLEIDDLFGSSVGALGDLNGDGIPDLMVGARGDGDGGNSRGAVYFLYLLSDGTVADVLKISSSRGVGVPIQLTNGDRIGDAVAVLGDLNRDGVVDVVIGAPGDDDGGTTRGAVWVTFLGGESTRYALPGDIVRTHKKISSSTGGFAGPLFNFDLFGTSVAGIGDLDGDGIEDLAVGSRGDDDGSDLAGAVWILFMTSGGAVKSHQKISDLQGNFFATFFAGDQFGTGLAGIGDLDGDGVNDIVVGSPNYDRGGLLALESGAIWIIFLNVDGTVKAYHHVSNLAGWPAAPFDAYDHFGRSIASLGDLDGDGVTDIAVGVPEDDDGGPNHGAVYLLNLETTGIVSLATKISDISGGFSGVLSNYDAFGTSVANVGDLNDDGVVDLVVGVPNDDDGGISRGAIWIIFLASNGFVASHQKISSTTGGLFGLILDEDGFGSAVTSMGDVDGDGILDLAIGARYDNEGATTTGATWIVMLNPDGTVREDRKISFFQGGFSGEIGKSDNFGASVTVIGDLDGDGLPELVVGADGDDDGSVDPNANRGAVWILYLNRIERGDIVADRQKISPLKGAFVGVLSDGDFFGTAVGGLGDLDGDGVPDVVVGARRDDDGGSSAGAVWILFLNPGGTVASEQKISSLSGGFAGVLSVNDIFGDSATGLGDLNNDGVFDVAVGAPGDDDGGTDRGAVWILFLAIDGTVSSHQKISNSTGGFAGSLANFDLFGDSVTSSGDLNNDGVADLVVGATGDDDGGTNRGAAWVLFMKTDGTVLSHQKISDTAGGFTGVLLDSDSFGFDVEIVGDVNGDGRLDLVVSAALDDDGGTDRGAAWVLFLNIDGTVSSHQKISDTAGGFAGALSDNDQFGSSLAAIPDFDGDGIPDLLVGASRDDDGANVDRGAVWLLFMNADGTVKKHEKVSESVGGMLVPWGGSDYFGWSATYLGDLNGDGGPDMMIGAPGSNDGGPDRGSTWFVSLKDRTGFVPKRRHIGPPVMPEEKSFRKRLGPLSNASTTSTTYSSTTSTTATTTTTSSFSTTSTGLANETIDFGTIDRWCQEEGTHMSQLSDAFNINDNSTTIGVDQKEINRRLINASLYEMSLSYKACLVSASIARLVDIGVGFVSINETLVPPKTFFDPFLLANFAYSWLYAGNSALQYHLERVDLDPRSMTGGAFAYHMIQTENVTDPMLLNFGLFADRMLRAARLLVYRNRGNLIGYVVNAVGELAYSNDTTANATTVVYYDGPMIPDGWRSPAWLNFTARYADGLFYGFELWKSAVGYDNRLWTLSYAGSLAELPAARLAWNRAGRVPADERYPAGRISQRVKFAELLDRELAPRNAWESNATALARASYAREVRRSRYPALEAERVNRAQDLIPGSIVCPIGSTASDRNCTVRKCWSPNGASVGDCVTRSGLLGRVLCKCQIPAESGACCAPSGCTFEANSSFCVGGRFVQGASCNPSLCTAALGACCGVTGSCSIHVDSATCLGNDTFLLGSDCAACADPDLIVGACCDAGSCAMTTEFACGGVWNPQRECSSQTLSGECMHCGARPCLECDLLFATVNDVVDFFFLNWEQLNDSAVGGACCFGGDPTNRSCVINARKSCDLLNSSVWYWGEQCSFCNTPLAFALPAPPRTVRSVVFEGDLETLVLSVAETVVNFGLRQGARVFSSLDGLEFTVQDFVAGVTEFVYTTDGDSPRSWRFWVDNLFLCDVFQDLFPESGPQGLGLTQGILWGTIVAVLLYRVVRGSCPFLGGLLAGGLLVAMLLVLIMLFAYFYSPACYGPAILPRYVLRTRASKTGGVESPIGGVGSGIPLIGGRVDKLTSRFAGGMTSVGGIMKRWGRKLLLTMVSIPLIPQRLIKDVRSEILARFDVECLPLCDVACPRESGKWPCSWQVPSDDLQVGCIDAPDCCAVAECPPSRVFPNCAAAPYDFRSSTRVLAYWMRVLIPKSNCFLFHGDFFLFAWIDRFPKLQTRFDFPGDDCEDPTFDDPRWRHCAMWNSLLLAPWVIVLVLLYWFLWPVLTLFWIVLKRLGLLVRRTMKFGMVASRRAIRTGSRVSQPPARGRATRENVEGALGHTRALRAHKIPAKKE